MDFLVFYFNVDQFNPLKCEFILGPVMLNNDLNSTSGTITTTTLITAGSRIAQLNGMSVH